MINKGRIFLLMAAFFIFTPALSLAGTIHLPQTGQTTCWDEDGAVITPCDGTGQDGDILAGYPWPSPRFTDNGDGSITDNLTGLTWLKDANCANTISHDPNGTGDGSMTWQHTLDFVAGINATTYADCGAGETDWRLSNVNELESLMYLETDNTTTWLEGFGFTNVGGASGFYWSSTTFVNTPANAWTVFIDGEFNNSFNKNNDQHVWPVRGTAFAPAPLWKTGQTVCYNSVGAVIPCTNTGQDGDVQAGTAWPSPRFTDNGDGTVTDNLTGVMWLQDANCMLTQHPIFDSDGAQDGKVSWQHALDFVAGINDGTYPNCQAGNIDWRLSNWKELHSLTDFSEYKPALPSGNLFTNLPAALSAAYWSSTTSIGVGGGDLDWLFNLADGLMNDQGKKLVLNYVWPVRAGTLQQDITVTDPINPTDDLQVPFGNVTLGYTSIQTVTITNDGVQDLIIGNIAQADTLSAPFSTTNDNCSGQTLSESANCTLDVRFSPSSKGIVTDTFDISSNDPDEPTVTVKVSGGSIELPKTGQTNCYGGGSTINCTDTEQDGDVQAGISWPSPRFKDNGDGTVTDELTGLMLLKDANCFGAEKWEDALDSVGDFNNTPTLFNCNSYDESNPPYTDWHLPNVNEVESLIHSGYNEETCGSSSCSTNGEWLDSQGFKNAQANSYWSSTTDILFKTDAWSVDMSIGSVYRGDKDFDTFYTWPVRAGQMGSTDPDYPANIWKTGQTTCYDKNGVQLASCTGSGQDGEFQYGVSWPETRFTDNGDGTITDYLTGLMWLKDANCIATKYPVFDNDGTIGDGRINWLNALDFILGIKAGTYPNCSASYTNWRLPNRKEIYSLQDFSQDSPSLPSGYPFSNVMLDYYWSSTTRSSSVDTAWRASLEEGFVLSDFKNVDNYIWPVHDDVVDMQSPTPTPLPPTFSRYLPLVMDQ